MDREAVRVRFYGSIEPWLAGIGEVFRSGRCSRGCRHASAATKLYAGSASPRPCSCFAGRICGKPDSNRKSVRVSGSAATRCSRSEAVAGWSAICWSRPRPECMLASKEELKDTLRAWYAEYRQTGQVLYRGEERKIRMPIPTRKWLSKFADILEASAPAEVSQASAAHV